MTDPTPAALDLPTARERYIAARIAQSKAADAKKLADDEVLIASALYRAAMKGQTA
jgi:predicted phage-related endonuclease